MLPYLLAMCTDKKATSCIKKKLSLFGFQHQLRRRCPVSKIHTHTHPNMCRRHTHITGIEKCGEHLSKKDIGVLLSRGGRAFVNLGLRDLAQEVKQQQPCPELNSLGHFTSQTCPYCSLYILYNCLSVYLWNRHWESMISLKISVSAYQ